MKRPDVFIVGAFKAGTTALYEYLRAHPQVFMSVPKEPMYFGTDLTPRYRRMTEAEYLKLFDAAQPAQHAGEASPWYLYSTAAAREIKTLIGSSVSRVEAGTGIVRQAGDTIGEIVTSSQRLNQLLGSEGVEDCLRLLLCRTRGRCHALESAPSSDTVRSPPRRRSRTTRRGRARW